MNLPTPPWLIHGPFTITPEAITLMRSFYQPPESAPAQDYLVTMASVALHNFIEAYQGCTFFQRHHSHSFGALANNETQLDYESILHLHALRHPKGWRIGTPSQFPLAEEYERERVVEEARLVLSMSEE